jgi:hypothetical protein
MPDDVAARLTAALAGGSSPSDGHADAGADAPSDDGGRRRTGLTLVPALDRTGEGGEEDTGHGTDGVARGGAGEGAGRAGRRGAARSAGRPRWTRWAGGVAAAAAVVVGLGFGVQALTGMNRGGDDAATSADGGGAPEVFAGSAPGGPRPPNEEQGRRQALPALAGRDPVASGVDYRRETLASANRVLSRADASRKPSASDPQDADSRVGSLLAAVPPALRRLVAPEAMDGCLAAIGAEHPRRATSIQLIDLASFEGSPAVVVLFTDAGGQRWVWVSGPDCGLGGAGADTRYQAKVG